MKRETDPLKILNRASQFADKKSVSLIKAQNSESIVSNVENISIDKIETKGNPRKSFNKESISELASTMESVGLLQPILVREKGSKYELIAGERRLRAAKHLGWKSIPAILKTVDDLDPDQFDSAKILENLQREDLSKEELSLAIGELVSKNYSQSEIAKLLGKSKQWVSQKVQHAGLIKEFPKAGELDSTTASRIFSQDKKLWKELVDQALHSSNARGLIQQTLSKKTGNSEKKSDKKFKTIESIKARILFLNKKINELQSEKAQLQSDLEKLKKSFK